MSDYLNDLFDLQGKTAVVIGGTGELCGAMALGLAKAGANIVVVGRNKEKAAARIAEIEGAGAKAVFVSCDVTSSASLASLRDAAVDAFDKIDILINGAGINSPTPVLEIPEEEYDRIMATNTKAVLLACQVFGKYFIDSEIPGSIINVGSMSGLTPLSRVFTYSMSKAAVHNLGKNLAREWAPRGIRVNTIVPGFFPAEQNRKVLTEDRIASIMGHTPMARFGESNELVGATLLLASARAGSFITGVELIVDGGYAAMTI